MKPNPVMMIYLIMVLNVGIRHLVSYSSHLLYNYWVITKFRQNVQMKLKGLNHFTNVLSIDIVHVQHFLWGLFKKLVNQLTVHLLSKKFVSHRFSYQRINLFDFSIVQYLFTSIMTRVYWVTYFLRLSSVPRSLLIIYWKITLSGHGISQMNPIEIRKIFRISRNSINKFFLFFN